MKAFEIFSYEMRPYFYGLLSFFCYAKAKTHSPVLYLSALLLWVSCLCILHLRHTYQLKNSHLRKPLKQQRRAA